MLVRVWRWAIVLAGCGAPVCSLDNAVAEVGQPNMDCGSASSSSPTTLPDETSFRAAHDCLAAAFTARTPVIARWFTPSIDSGDVGAWIGVAEGAGYAIYEIVGGGMTVDERTTTRRCASIADHGACATVLSDLCFTCETSITTASCGR